MRLSHSAAVVPRSSRSLTERLLSLQWLALLLLHVAAAAAQERQFEIPVGEALFLCFSRERERGGSSQRSPNLWMARHLKGQSRSGQLCLRAQADTFLRTHLSVVTLTDAVATRSLRLAPLLTALTLHADPSRATLSLPLPATTIHFPFIVFITSGSLPLHPLNFPRWTRPTTHLESVHFASARIASLRSVARTHTLVHPIGPTARIETIKAQRIRFQQHIALAGL